MGMRDWLYLKNSVILSILQVMKTGFACKKTSFYSS